MWTTQFRLNFNYFACFVTLLLRLSIIVGMIYSQRVVAIQMVNDKKCMKYVHTTLANS